MEETEYLQRLEGEDPVYEWVEATGLRPILNGLGDADRERFVEVYRERLRAAYPRRTGGHTLYPFRRLFMVVTRRGCELRGRGITPASLRLDGGRIGAVDPRRTPAGAPRGRIGPAGAGCRAGGRAFVPNGVRPARGNGIRRRSPAARRQPARRASWVPPSPLDMSTSAVSRQIKTRKVRLGAKPFTGAQP